MTKEAILNSNNIMKLNKLYFLAKAVSGELDDKKCNYINIRHKE